MSTMSSSAALDGLLCFARVVEAGSFAAAARRMGLTTSGVSKIIARFEASYGVRLLHRSTHSGTCQRLWYGRGLEFKLG